LHHPLDSHGPAAQKLSLVDETVVEEDVVLSARSVVDAMLI
jgi:hypothetical protein